MDNVVLKTICWVMELGDVVGVVLELVLLPSGDVVGCVSEVVSVRVLGLVFEIELELSAREVDDPEGAVSA